LNVFAVAIRMDEIGAQHKIIVFDSDQDESALDELAKGRQPLVRESVTPYIVFNNQSFGNLCSHSYDHFVYFFLKLPSEVKGNPLTPSRGSALHSLRGLRRLAVTPRSGPAKGRPSLSAEGAPRRKGCAGGRLRPDGFWRRPRSARDRPGRQ